MIANAKIKYLKVSPRKLRLVVDLVRNKTVADALAMLNHLNKKSAEYVYKAVHSAAANAKRIPNVDENSLIITKIFADGGPMLKRYRSAPMGMAAPIRKRTSHLTVELDMGASKKSSVKSVATKKTKTDVAKALKVTKKPKAAVKKSDAKAKKPSAPKTKKS